MSHIQCSKQGLHRSAAGFTLIEMLVSVTLVLIMMTLFAQIFQMAGSSISKQRGLAENDQRSRTIQTILKADLDKRTLRWVYPFAANEVVSSPESYIGKRQGFLYISENNPFSKVDDILHFSIASTMTARNKDQSPYYGKALTFPATDTASPPNLDFTTNPFIQFPNQPDADDAQSTPNDTGLSTVAEIIYFVRNGNLYRRQLLVREPVSIAAIGGKSQPDTSNSNQNVNGVNLFTLATAPGYNYLLGQGYASTFWNDFDYAAHFSPTGAVFSGSDSLDNSAAATNALANPKTRYGHDSITGLPKEFLYYSSSPPTSLFIGSYKYEECSHSSFQYPQSFSAAGNPMDPSFPGSSGTDTDGNGYNQLDLNADGTIDNWAGGPRRGEDLLLSNVHSFDVQVWDARAFGGRFVDIGDPQLNSADSLNSGPSDYAPNARTNSNYGPNSTSFANAVFDTWHPKVDLNTDGTFESPPFQPVTYRPQIVTGGSTIYDKPSWQANTSYTAGQSVIFPSATNLPNGWPYYYQCIQSGISDNTMPTALEPNWPKTDSVKVNDGSVVWQTVDNRRPLKAIKIEVRFIDPSTQQMRQLTLIQSLVD